VADVIIPYTMAIPIETAASLRFDGEVTARDISYAVLTAFLAAQAGQSGEVRLSDNGLRAALRRTRRDRVAAEVARIERAGLTRVTTDEIAGEGGDSVPMPTQPVWRHLDGSPAPDRHHPPGGDLKWLVDEKLMAAFMVTDDVQTVEFPTRILQFAKSRYTSILMMRLLAIQAGWGDPRWTHEIIGNHTALRIPISDLREILGLPSSMPPSQIMRDVLALATREINELADGYRLEAYPREVGARPALGTRPAIRGRVADFELIISREIRVQPSVVFAEKPEPVTGWRHPIPRGPRPNYYAPPQAPAQNVAPFRRPAAPSNTLARPTLPVARRSIADDDAEIPF
jgi:hypothetical protein